MSVVFGRSNSRKMGLAMFKRLSVGPMNISQAIPALISAHKKGDTKSDSNSSAIPGAVFGNDLKDIPKFLDSNEIQKQELPEFLVRIITKIELNNDTVGLYRVNGVATDVQQIRYAVNAKNYDLLEGCQNVATLTSTLKLFLREMTAPLINKEMVNNIKISNVSLTGKGDQGTLILQLKKSLGVIDKLSYRVLHYILLHAKHVADNKGNKMDASNMAIVIGPNIVHHAAAGDYGEILAEMEMGQRLVEMLIIYVNEVFEVK